jgi:hypothetical protein
MYANFFSFTPLCLHVVMQIPMQVHQRSLESFLFTMVAG